MFRRVTGQDAGPSFLDEFAMNTYASHIGDQIGDADGRLEMRVFGYVGIHRASIHLV
jgi:hypothetical protein